MNWLLLWENAICAIAQVCFFILFFAVTELVSTIQEQRSFNVLLTAELSLFQKTPYPKCLHRGIRYER